MLSFDDVIMSICQIIANDVRVNDAIIPSTRPQSPKELQGIDYNKQRVLMHGYQGWNVRHGLCHIYMRYVYIYELFIAFVSFVVCSLL